ncbi:MAG: hypothetical protein CVU66_00580 [Deltaproteobacteria bacterium HGW-Deltaproteobacteria-23]|nr:MAG: hypothetical protein CVU66_00580 [Deltaproteobacteria bacterium HGW-Deltaproteobacteria-23]
MRNVSFELYRYQLLPMSRQVQQDFLHDISSVEDIERNKNKFLGEILDKFPSILHKTHHINQKREFYENDILCLKVAVQKSLERDRADFRKERLENWPNVTILINNRQDIQMIAVSKNEKAFTSSAVIIKSIVALVNARLKSYQLQMHAEAMFDKKEFWAIVMSHRTRIQTIKFELISPNLANISSQLKLDLKQLNKDTNSHKTNLEFNSPAGATLEVNESNQMINSLLDYASQGGGDISFKVRGYKKKIHTSTSIKTVEIDELMVENLTPTQVDHFTDLFKV